MRPIRILNATQMRAVERRTIDDVGIPSIVLMENAGRQVVSAMDALIERLDTRHVAVLCGVGNNGGDGFVVARTLQQRGIDANVFILGTMSDIRGDARVNLDIIGRLGVSIVEIADAQAWELHGSHVTSADVVVDAVVGTGLSRPLSGLHETVAADVNASAATVVAIDVPSGLSADVSDLIGPVLKADLTVTLAAPKLPLVLPPAEHVAGDVVVADIGVPASILEQADGPRLHLLTRDAVAALVPSRAPDQHKGDCGRVVIVAGSRGKTGAAVLAARGALRSGAGLVTVAVPAGCQSTVAAQGVEYMTHGLDDTVDGTVDFGAVEHVLALAVDVVAVGPGLGQGPAVSPFVRDLLSRCGSAMVVDADALNACADDPAVLAGRDERPVVITPHPGEMARLLGCSVRDVQTDRLRAAVEFAVAHHVHVVLKGYRTVIATPDGHAFVNPTGTPGMATGGSGDVLTGMIAAWIGQGLAPGIACLVAVYVHGAAGELAERDEGEVSMTAGDISSRIGEALQDLRSDTADSPSP